MSERSAQGATRRAVDIDGEKRSSSNPQPATAGDLWELVLAKFQRATSLLISDDRRVEISAASHDLDAALNVNGLIDAVSPAPR